MSRVRGYTTFLAVGAIVVGLMAAMLVATSTVATASDQAAPPTQAALKQECVAAGLVMPKTESAEMANPGKKHGSRLQIVGIRVLYPAVPTACNGKFRRLGQVKTLLQNPLKRKHWFNLDPALKWRTMYSSGNKAGEGGANIISNGHEGPNVYYRCSPGKRKTRVKAIYRNQVKDLATGRIVGQKFKTQQVRVKGGGC